MDGNYNDFSEMAHDARRTLERERDELMERAGLLEAHLRVLDSIDDVLAENRRLKDEVENMRRLKDENEELRQQMDDEKRQRAELEMKLMEMSKLSTGMAKKATEENVLKALRTYVNRSKRKTADKRAFAKSATLEIANANGLDLPEDLKAAIESLDDEQSEAKMIVTSNYKPQIQNQNVNLPTPPAGQSDEKLLEDEQGREPETNDQSDGLDTELPAKD